jgi:hypothetical protein
MSWVKSTCMACIGVEEASLDSISLSGAPVRAMPPAGSRAVAIVGCWSPVWKRGGSRCEARTRLLSEEAMHGESTQALRGEQAVQAGAVQRPGAEASGVCEALAGVKRDRGADKGLAARRTVRHGQTVIARWSGFQRTSVHG